MRISKIFAAAAATLLVVACGTPAAEGSKEAQAFLPTKSQIDSASYLIGVNFGSWIKGNNFGELLCINSISRPRTKRLPPPFKLPLKASYKVA